MNETTIDILNAALAVAVCAGTVYVGVRLCEWIYKYVMKEATK